MDEPLHPGPFPDRLWDDLTLAAARCDRLAEDGLSVRFELGDQGPMKVELCDLDGAVVRALEPGEVMAIACDSSYRFLT